MDTYVTLAGVMKDAAATVRRRSRRRGCSRACSEPEAQGRSLALRAHFF